MDGELKSIAEELGIEISDSVEIPGREAVYRPPPPELKASIRDYLAHAFPRGLYRHQATAISASLAGRDVCLATSTASGKSHVFLSVATQILTEDRHSRVIAFYPIKALLHDQLAKWKLMLAPFGCTAAFIDGSVDTKERSDILLRHRVILMTPDVAHAWFMSSLSDKNVELVRKNLRLLILDEAHVYDGVFGTNMAFFLRRFQAVCAPCRLICSTATLGHPRDFVSQLTGRESLQIGPELEGAAVPQKTLQVARLDVERGFDLSAQLIKKLAKQYSGRFIAFADSRKMVELITAAAHRAEKANTTDEALQDWADETANHLVPYRAGYENVDRIRIQQALTEGRLRGVVSTSAFELGLDIGDISAVILLTPPPSMKSFWQRIGRAGRVNKGECLILDTTGAVVSSPGGLRGYLQRPIEPNWLYRDNRYIQYTNALCAAQETQDSDDPYDSAPFETLPAAFTKFLAEEVNPTQMLPPDLFSLKQRAQGADPHHEFPLRNGVEPSFKIISENQQLGEVSFSQMLREAYPGAVYYYMARPFRIISVNSRLREIVARPEGRYTTKPITQVMVFPDLFAGVRRLLMSAEGLVAEAEMQVSERVVGFKEKRGLNELNNKYELGSPYSQRSLQRFIKTTGVCWYFPDNSVISDAVAERVRDTFCREFAVQPRELGVGRFHVQQSPLGTGSLQGVCVFDATHGSLRLTERLGEYFKRVAHAALDASENEIVGGFSSPILAPLKSFCRYIEALEQKAIAIAPGSIEAPAAAGQEWLDVIAANEKAMLISGTEATEVTVLSYFYTPQGLKYHLKHDPPDVRWTVEAHALQPFSGTTKTVVYNPLTGEEKAKQSEHDGRGLRLSARLEASLYGFSEDDSRAITSGWEATNQRRLELIENGMAGNLTPEQKIELQGLQRLAGLKRELLSVPSLKELQQIEADLRRRELWRGE